MNKLIVCSLLFLGLFFQKATAQDKVSVAFNNSLKKYYVLKNALATDKAELAQQAAIALQQAVKEVPHKGFKDDAQHQLWMEESAVILAQSADLAKSSDLKSQRKSFEGISQSFIKVTQQLALNLNVAYLQYCPMGKFSWLNEVKDIQNPYYGSMMYDCGTVKSTIAGK
ncbi:DUF3347 domain-containing protein [Pedobacter sp. MC2016-14]|uniref:DUF3347 domain-containing protein n=1 Tax=Pedobacter sp. MC2016-14 TaxID=2897327 RepID=UPI001E652645|nr:DUF3347 domain-containing protein [Pedobacter sp. MC2016-14]MCD0487320.1 DUF3347 domain-containing protein [Pedobacter sp. MC2016-14]